MRSPRRLRILFFVESPHGEGHLARVSALAKPLVREGHDVHVGTSTQVRNKNYFYGVKLHYAKPAYSNLGDYLDPDVIFDPKGEFEHAGQIALSHRNSLLDIFREVKPDLLVIEGYPFLRQSMEWAIETIIAEKEKVNSNMRVISIVRDHIGYKAIPSAKDYDPKTDVISRKHAKFAEIFRQYDKYIDHLFICGDSSHVPFDVDVNGTHVGYAVDLERGAPINEAIDEILVAVGGGEYGKEILHCALEAHGHSPAMQSSKLHLISGIRTTKETVKDLVAKAESLNLSVSCPELGMAREDTQVVIDPFCENLPERMKYAKVVVSSAGCNQVGEILAAGANSVMVPLFKRTGDEIKTHREQVSRARLLSRAGVAEMVEDHQLQSRNPTYLADAVERAARRNNRPPPVRTNGAEAFAAHIRHSHESHPAF